jgi:hypothetical protein
MTHPAKVFWRLTPAGLRERAAGHVIGEDIAFRVLYDDEGEARARAKELAVRHDTDIGLMPCTEILTGPKWVKTWAGRPKKKGRK